MYKKSQWKDTRDGVEKGVEPDRYKVKTKADATGRRASIDLTGIRATQASPAFFGASTYLPTDIDDELSFDFSAVKLGSGDWLAVYFGNTLLWSTQGMTLESEVLYEGVVDVSAFKGRTDNLLFYLHDGGPEQSSIFFTDWDGTGGEVPGVPEPSTWAMLVGGFGLLGAAARRHRTHISYA